MGNQQNGNNNNGQYKRSEFGNTVFNSMDYPNPNRWTHNQLQQASKILAGRALDSHHGSSSSNSSDFGNLIDGQPNTVKSLNQASPKRGHGNGESDTEVELECQDSVDLHNGKVNKKRRLRSEKPVQRKEDNVMLQEIYHKVCGLEKAHESLEAGVMGLTEVFHGSLNETCANQRELLKLEVSRTNDQNVKDNLQSRIEKSASNSEKVDRQVDAMMLQWRDKLVLKYGNPADDKVSTTAPTNNNCDTNDNNNKSTPSNSVEMKTCVKFPKFSSRVGCSLVGYTVLWLGFML